MLDPLVVDFVRRLLAEGKWSMRKIARMTGVSRGTVSAIAHGKRPDRRPRTEQDDLLERPSGPMERCPGCGGMVQMPCRLCRVRAWRASPQCRRLPPRNEQPLRLELAGEHRIRYEALRARRMREAVLADDPDRRPD
ncbi:MAG: helix-turn-helix domain-containing protein [Thermoguttaceae bacterium]